MSKEKDNKPVKTFEEMFDDAYNMGVDACIQLTSQSYGMLKAAMGDEAIEKFHNTYNTLITCFKQIKKQP